MKRMGQLLDAIADPDNLRLAFWKASKGKRAKPDCRTFQASLDTNLSALRAELLSGQVLVGNYHYFTIHDPKERTICASAFRERVLYHAVMNLCVPVLERAAVFDSYACRKGKGQLAAVRRAQSYARQPGWFLKLDVRKYFDSVDHSVLRKLLRRKFKDPVVLGLFDQVLASYETTPGRGLPIGNLTSQHFANYYLAPLDRYIKERLRRTAYVRYMDDFVVWGESSGELGEVRRQVEAFLASELHLALKPNASLNRTAFGMNFLGYRIFRRELRLARRSKVRFARKFRRYEAQWAAGRWTELQLQQRMQALVAFTLPACSRSWRRQVMDRFGVMTNGLEPRDSRRQLEQQERLEQSQELPIFGEAQLVRQLNRRLEIRGGTEAEQAQARNWAARFLRSDDNDGFLDLFMICGNGGISRVNHLYRNNGPATGKPNHWLKVKLTGQAANRLGIGAKVRVKATIDGREIWQLRELTGNGYSQTCPGLIVHFGIGDATKADIVRIEWPSGTVEELANLARDQFHTIVEPSLRGAMLAGGQFELSVTATLNRVRTIEFSSDLGSWTPLTTVTAQGETAVTYLDTNAPGQDHRFYRMR